MVRRRFQDFAFLREHLAKAFPACIVPPIPDKHRLGSFSGPCSGCIDADLTEYIKGDRFAPDFIEKRRME